MKKIKPKLNFGKLLYDFLTLDIIIDEEVKKEKQQYEEIDLKAQTSKKRKRKNSLF